MSGFGGGLLARIGDLPDAQVSLALGGFGVFRKGFMQGTIEKRKCGYKWMRIGRADVKFSKTILAIALPAMILLAIWAYREIPDSKWRLGNFTAIYMITAFLYTNIGVWLHEQLHCLAFRGAIDTDRIQISFNRKHILFLNGHYTVRGSITYGTNRRALLAPIGLPIGLSAVGLLGYLFLPGWWLPVSLTMAVAGLIDMTHDFYMLSKIRSIGEKGKYWDRGHYLEAVWKEQVYPNAS